jgi:hypothetical protein
MDLTRSFAPEQFARGLESWEWIGLGGKVPIFASLFGDVFLRSDDGFWWLDTLEGRLALEWPTAGALQTDLATPDGQDRYLLAGLAMSAERHGLILGSHEIYVFEQPPLLGGAVEAGNIGKIDFEVGLCLAGELHVQIQELAPGASISGVAISGENA